MSFLIYLATGAVVAVLSPAGSADKFAVGVAGLYH